MNRIKFNNIDIHSGINAKNGQDWQKENNIQANWRTPEQIDIQPVYTKEDLEGMEHLDFAAGIAVFALGYNNKEYNDAIKNQVDKLIHTSNLFSILI